MLAEKNNEEQRSFWSAKRRWILDAVLALSAFVVIATSLYFLYLPTGYQGGRNPYYEISILFARVTWDALHTWGGILMILIALAHVAVHWRWFFTHGTQNLAANAGGNRKIESTRARKFVGKYLTGCVIPVVCIERGLFYVCPGQPSGD